MRLIVDEGALDGEGACVEEFAERLGIGARQLARLFARHLKATPIQVAKTARLQRAKRLLDLTELPMTEVALRAGFGSLCRFNAVYKRSPTEIRRLARANGRRGAGKHARQLDDSVEDSIQAVLRKISTPRSGSLVAP